MNSKYRVLLIEDNPGDRKLTLEAFKELDFSYDLQMAFDGEQGIEAVNEFSTQTDKNEQPDLVLLDLNMPKRNGFEVLSKIRENKSFRSVPVIILSTSASQEDIHRAYETGANCYISKPVDYDKFVHCLKMIEQFWIKTTLLPSYCDPYKTLAS